MKCSVCKTNEALPDSIVCSERCDKIRRTIHILSNKYFPTPGCPNCWGDYGGSCTDKCRAEFSASREFVNDLYELIRL